MSKCEHKEIFPGGMCRQCMADPYEVIKQRDAAIAALREECDKHRKMSSDMADRNRDFHARQCEHDWQMQAQCPYCEIARLQAENDSLRAMITTYNLGGWTDIEQVAKEISRLTEQNAKQAALIEGLQRAVDEKDAMEERLAAAQNELDQYRKVVWHLEKGEWQYKSVASDNATFWYINDIDAKANGIDIEELQKGIGK